MMPRRDEAWAIAAGALFEAGYRDVAIDAACADDTERAAVVGRLQRMTLDAVDKVDELHKIDVLDALWGAAAAAQVGDVPRVVHLAQHAIGPQAVTRVLAVVGGA